MKGKEKRAQELIMDCLREAMFMAWCKAKDCEYDLNDESKLRDSLLELSYIIVDTPNVDEMMKKLKNRYKI